jgi:hypothetical protein
MNAATPLYGTKEAPVKWSVIGYRESTFVVAAGTPDAHVVPGSCCDKCGAAIRYVVRVKSEKGQVMDVGRDCAVTLEGGPDLAEIRRAEKEYELEQYRASPEYRERMERERVERESKAERAARAEIEHAEELRTYRAIVESNHCSKFEKERAARYITAITEGTRWTEPDAEDAETLRIAGIKASLPDSKHAGAVGAKVEVKRALFEFAMKVGIDGPFPTWMNKFRAETGECIVWFSNACPLVGTDLGKWVSIKGTVKKVGDYNGEAQTTLTRCKVVKLEEGGAS